MKLPWSKKPWDKVACQFELQEYTPGVKGWHTITEPTGRIPTIAEAKEFFKPGHHYRVIARSVEEKEGFQAGTYVGVAWKYYEPAPGGIVKKEVPKPKKERPGKPIDVPAMMDQYVEEVDRILQPIAKFADVMNQVRESFLGFGGGGGGNERGSEQETFQPIEFEGKAPWFLHPTIIHYVGEEVKGVVDHFTVKLQQALGTQPPAGAVAEEEEPTLPSIKEYLKPTEPIEEEVEEEIEEEVEEPEEEKEAVIPSLKVEEEPIEGEPPEEGGEEVEVNVTE